VLPNSRLRHDYAKTLPLTGGKKGKISVPLGLHFETFTDDVPAETNKNRGQKYLDASHLNVFILIPPITTILNAMLRNKTLQNMVNDEANAKIFSYICRYQYWTKPSTNNKVYPALIKYCPSSTLEFKKKIFINNLMGYDQVVPVTIFLVIMYNACMLYQNNKKTNLLISTLQRFDMIGKVSDNTFIDTMSEYLCDTYILNLEYYAHIYLNFYIINQKMIRRIILVCFGCWIRSGKQDNKTAR
jgi:hypothetical protein